MKRFLIILTIFIVPVVAALGIVEYKLRKIPNEYISKNEYLRKNSDGIEVLYLGNSHIYFGLNPEFSKYRAYNAAYTSQSADLDWKIVNKYKNSFKDLKYIILPADYISVYQTLDNTAEGWRVKNYNLYYGFSIGLKPAYYFEIFNGKFKENFDRLNSYYVQHIQPKKNSNVLGFGISYQYPSQDNLIKSTSIAIERHSVDLNSAEASYSYHKNTHALENFVHFAEKKNIKLIFISTPVTGLYYQKSHNKQLESSLAVYNDLAKKYPKVCYYYNFMQDKNFANNDFYDGDHLNNMGARKLVLFIDKKLSEIEN